ncbi:hypothetical protein SDC9_88237 [bioreactor metagenome]|uniref:Uncharacterized protein n=1 Tax=bioreactor metagenome TaxID=1076179 RepID=A0A644ZL20_9ZZZZ
MQRVGRRAAEDGRTEILEYCDLALGVSAGNRNGRGSNLERRAVHAKPAGEQPVAIGNVDDVLRAAARGINGTRAAVRPDVEVVLCVTHHNLLAGRAGGSVQADDVLHRNGEHAVRIGVPQVLLVGERELL